MCNLHITGDNMCVCVCVSQAVISNSLQPHRLYPTRLLCAWNSPGKNTGAGCHFLFQQIFPTKGSNPGLLHYRQILYHLSHREAHKMVQLLWCSSWHGRTYTSFYSAISLWRIHPTIIFPHVCMGIGSLQRCLQYQNIQNSLKGHQ